MSAHKRGARLVTAELAVLSANGDCSSVVAFASVAAIPGLVAHRGNPGPSPLIDDVQVGRGCHEERQAIGRDREAIGLLRQGRRVRRDAIADPDVLETADRGEISARPIGGEYRRSAGAGRGHGAKGGQVTREQTVVNEKAGTK